MLTKLVPGQLGLSQHLNSKAACLVIRPAVSPASPVFAQSHHMGLLHYETDCLDFMTV